MSFQATNNQTSDINVELTNIKRTLDANAGKAALEPSYEGNAYIEPSRVTIDYVDVTETTDPSQSVA
jgi:hypothetical protein